MVTTCLIALVAFKQMIISYLRAPKGISNRRQPPVKSLNSKSKRARNRNSQYTLSEKLKWISMGLIVGATQVSLKGICHTIPKY